MDTIKNILLEVSESAYLNEKPKPLAAGILHFDEWGEVKPRSALFSRSCKALLQRDKDAAIFSIGRDYRNSPRPTKGKHVTSKQNDHQPYFINLPDPRLHLDVYKAFKYKINDCLHFPWDKRELNVSPSCDVSPVQEIPSGDEYDEKNRRLQTKGNGSLEPYLRRVLGHNNVARIAKFRDQGKFKNQIEGYSSNYDEVQELQSTNHVNSARVPIICPHLGEAANGRAANHTILGNSFVCVLANKNSSVQQGIKPASEGIYNRKVKKSKAAKPSPICTTMPTFVDTMTEKNVQKNYSVICSSPDMTADPSPSRSPPSLLLHRASDEGDNYPQIQTGEKRLHRVRAIFPIAHASSFTDDDLSYSCKPIHVDIEKLKYFKYI